MAYETAVLMQLGARTAKHPIRMGGFSAHIRLTDYGDTGELIVLDYRGLSMNGVLPWLPCLVVVVSESK